MTKATFVPRLKMRSRRWGFLVAVALLLASGSSTHAEQPAIVVRVVDGDTVDVRLADGRTERLRLIGMDTPETVDPRKPVQCFGREASDHAHTLLDGQQVSIVGDPSQDTRDRYGRLLAYIWRADGLFYNQEMIAAGFAHEYTYQLPYQYQADFKAAQQAAQTQQLGLWSPATCSGNTTQATGTAPLATGGPDDTGSAPDLPAATTVAPPPANTSSGKAAPVSQTDCPASHPIKGNRSSMIYHSPGGSFYSRTNPEECFAAAGDAQAAGYRASQR